MELDQALKPKLTKYIPTTPSVKQTAFLLLHCRDAFFGGAAGGGKSEALLMGALQYADQPKYDALIVRRTFRDLNQPEAIMNRCYHWLYPYRKTGEVHWNSDAHRWTFPSGATLTFGHLDKIGDEFQYQGAEFQYIAFDELTQFYEAQALYLFSRLRRKTGSTIPLRFRAASNPGGMGHEWVKARYIINGRKNKKIFIPSLLTDNPGVDQAEYIESLSELDYVTLQQLLKGDWDASYDGGLFKREWFTHSLVDDAPDLTSTRLVWHWDLAASLPSPNYPDPDYTAGLLLASSPGRKIRVLNVVRERRTPKGVESLIRSCAEQYGKRAEIFIEQEPGSAGVNLVNHYITNVLPDFYVKGSRPSGDKFTRAKPLSAKMEHYDIEIQRAPWNTDFINECVWFDGSGKGHDDQVDAFSGAWEDLQTGAVSTMRQVPIKGRNSLNFTQD